MKDKNDIFIKLLPKSIIKQIEKEIFEVRVTSIIALLLILGGIIILFTVNWKIALGLFLFAWGQNISRIIENKYKL